MIKNIILVIVIFTLGYSIYIFSKPGIKVTGSENVINPFLDESSFSNTYGGINPYSTANHITEKRLQSIKLEKITEILYFIIPTIIVLSLFIKKKRTEESETVEDNSQTLTNEEEMRLSLIEMAIKLECLPEHVKPIYLEEIKNNNFGYLDLIASENAWLLKKSEDANLLSIKPENTPAALMYNWTKEYRLENFKNSKT